MSLRAPASKLRRLDHQILTPPTVLLQCRRRRHTSRLQSAVTAPTAEPAIPITPHRPVNAKDSSLAILPTSTVLRNYMITSMSSSPVLLKACFTILKRMLDSKSVLFSPERNPVLRWVFMQTFYKQFCAGENKEDVARTVEKVKKMGFEGVIFEYALEVLSGEPPSKEETRREIEVFRKGMRDTIEVAGKGDFIGLKWSGLGREAFSLIAKNKPPTPEMLECIHELCDAAKAKGTYFLPGAEEEYVNHGLDTWTLDLMRKYNRDRPFMYNTYQLYLRSCAPTLASHLAIAQKEGFIPGIKLVRGAYRTSEPEGAVWGSWEETNRQYDGVMEAMLKRRWNSILQPPSGSDAKQPFPEFALMLATHNAESLRKAQEIRNEQAARGDMERPELGYAQLQGMADELSCELVACGKQAVEGGEQEMVDRPRAFKCATWGTLGECLNFLMRRAVENQDAMGRTVESRRAMGREIGRRVRASLGMA